MMFLLAIITVPALLFRISFTSDCPLAVDESGTYKCQARLLKEVPNNIPKETRTLDLANNKIEILHEDNFRNLPSLRKLILDNNTIWKITEYAFKRLVKLEILHLNNNYLVIQSGGLSSAAFEQLVSLKELSISRNPLGIIPDGFFRTHINLEVLRIDNALNKLRIEDNAFIGLNKLRTLSLVDNSLEELGEHFESAFNLMDLQEIYLDGNKWDCDCKLKWLKRWYLTRSRRRHIDTIRTNFDGKSLTAKCSAPSYLYGRDLFNVSVSNFQCHPQLLSKPMKAIHVKAGANVSLLCEFYSDPREFIVWLKNDTKMQTEFGRIYLHTTNGQEFTTNLTITQINKNDQGVYKCVAKNRRGRASATFTINVLSNYYGVKGSVIVTLIAITGSGLIVLLVAIGIIIYCFYGRDHPKFPVSTSNNNNQQSYQNLINGRNKNQTNNQEVLEHILDKQHEATQNTDRMTTLPIKHTGISSESEAKGEAQVLFQQSGILCNSPNIETTNKHNDNCPVHGSKLNYSPCPVHGLVKQSHDKEINDMDNSNRIITTGNNFFHQQPSGSNSSIQPCPVHGLSNPGMVYNLPQQQLCHTTRSRSFSIGSTPVYPDNTKQPNLLTPLLIPTSCHTASSKSSNISYQCCTNNSILRAQPTITTTTTAHYSHPNQYRSLTRPALKVKPISSTLPRVNNSLFPSLKVNHTNLIATPSSSCSAQSSQALTVRFQEPLMNAASTSIVADEIQEEPGNLNMEDGEAYSTPV